MKDQPDTHPVPVMEIDRLACVFKGTEGTERYVGETGVGLGLDLNFKRNLGDLRQIFMRHTLKEFDLFEEEKFFNG